MPSKELTPEGKPLAEDLAGTYVMNCQKCKYLNTNIPCRSYSEIHCNYLMEKATSFLTAHPELVLKVKCPICNGIQRVTKNCSGCKGTGYKYLPIIKGDSNA